MILFGPSGNSESFYAKGFSHTEQSAKYVKDMGLDCFEYSFGRGVRMSEAKAVSIGDAFREQGVEISVHAPYYINFANPSDESAQNSYNYVLDSGRVLKQMGGTRCVFHSCIGVMKRSPCGIQGKLDRMIRPFHGDNSSSQVDPLRRKSRMEKQAFYLSQIIFITRSNGGLQIFPESLNSLCIVI